MYTYNEENNLAYISQNADIQVLMFCCQVSWSNVFERSNNRSQSPLYSFICKRNV